jgi:hypothetical protein
MTVPQRQPSRLYPRSALYKDTGTPAKRGSGMWGRWGFGSKTWQMEASSAVSTKQPSKEPPQ